MSTPPYTAPRDGPGRLIPIIKILVGDQFPTTFMWQPEMARARAQGRDVSLWGWHAFFEEVARFEQSSERQLASHANECNSQYVLDRLKLIALNVSRIRQHM